MKTLQRTGKHGTSLKGTAKAKLNGIDYDVLVTKSFPDAKDSNSNNLQIIDSMKIFLLLLLVVLLATSQAQTQPEETVNDRNAPSNGTESYFVSPHALGRTPEVTQALDKMLGQVKVARTTYSVSGLTYIIHNVTLNMVYNPSKQVVTIPKADLMQITGGKIEFTYKFNFSKIENGNTVTGNSYGKLSSM